MVDRTRQYSASLETPTVRSHSPYCEATGPIVDEGFVSARIRELQKVYNQTWTPTQSHSPMSPCPIYPKLQKYEFSSRAEPNESPTGPSATRTHELTGSNRRPSLRSSHVSARYFKNSESLGASNRSVDDVEPTKIRWPGYRKLIRRGYGTSAGNLTESLEEPAPSFSTLRTAGIHRGNESPTNRRTFPQADQGLGEDRIEMPKADVGRRWSNATRFAAKNRNESQERLGFTCKHPASISPPDERKGISDHLQDQSADIAPLQVTKPLCKSPVGQSVVHNQSRAYAESSSVSVQEHETPRQKDDLGLASSPTPSIAHEDTAEHSAWNSPPNYQQTGSPPRASRSKGGYGDLVKAHAHSQLLDTVNVSSDAEARHYAEAPAGNSSDLSRTSSRAEMGNLRRQSLPAKLGGSTRHQSNASSKAPSVLSSTRSSSLWKKWRSWKLVLVDKPPSSQASSDRSKDSSLSSVNEAMDQPHDIAQTNPNLDLPFPDPQRTINTSSTHHLPKLSREGEIDETEAPKPVESAPKSQPHQFSETAPEPSKVDTRQGNEAVAANMTSKASDTISAKDQPSKLVATFPLDASLLESNTTLFRDGGDDNGDDESAGSMEGGKGRRIKNIQIVISFDEMADLVIEAHLKGNKKQTAR